MKDVHVISIIALVYSVILALVTFIFYRDYVTWAILGSAVALFNHSLMIQVTKSKPFSGYKLASHLVQRYVFFAIIIALVYFETRDGALDVMITSYIVLLLGMVSVKIGVLIYGTPLIRKPEEVEVHADDRHDHDIPE